MIDGGSVTLDMADVVKEATLNIEVTGGSRLRWRISAGSWFIRLGARIMGVGATCLSLDRVGGVEKSGGRRP